MRGWYGEPNRHSLAAYGIQTAENRAQQIMVDENKVPPEELYPINFDRINAGETEKFIKLFWWCSINDAWSWFSFDDFFGLSKDYINNWLHFHFGPYTKHIEDDGSNIAEVLERVWEDAVGGRLLDGDVELMTLIESDGFTSVESKLEEFSSLLEKLDKVSVMSDEEKIVLVEELIHFEHVHGSIWETDIPKLRKEFEEVHS